MKRNLMKIMVLAISLSIALTQFFGCSIQKAASAQCITFNLGAEPLRIDPAQVFTTGEADVVSACFEGLMRLDRNDKAIPGIAASYTKDSDVKYTFKLRDAMWSDGKPVSAYDFEYAWKRALAPETDSEYAYQLFYIKGGRDYNAGNAGPGTVGIKALDNKTLEVNLEAPVPYFLELLALPVFMPVREDIVRRNPDIWANEPALYIGNGPFKLSSWVPGENLELVKNNNYYDASRVRLDRLIFSLVEDSDAYYTAFETGDIDIIESPPAYGIQMLKDKGMLKETPGLGVYFYAFNNNTKPLNDSRVRKALAYAINRPIIIQDVVKSGAVPAAAFVPEGIPEASDIGKDFRTVGGLYISNQADVTEAQRLLKEAGYPGGKGFPKLTLVYNDNGSHAETASLIQDMWKRNLGINVNIQVQDAETLQKSKSIGSFDIIRQGWIADFIDPMAFLELFVTNSENNIARYSSKAYDGLIYEAKLKNDPSERSRILHQAEAVLMDDMPILPVYFYTNYICMKPYVKGVEKSPLGYIYFDQAYVEGK